MPSCVVVFADYDSANQLIHKLQNASAIVSKCQLIQPRQTKQNHNNSPKEQTNTTRESTSQALVPVEIHTIKWLNPELSKKLRQRNMAMWLMPFGFLAGLTFTQMTGLQTFSNVGLGPVGEPLIGSLLGMMSGWIGSQVAARSVTSDKIEDINTLRKLNEVGRWLLILETPEGIEFPWNCVQEVNPMQIMRFSDL